MITKLTKSICCVAVTLTMNNALAALPYSIQLYLQDQENKVTEDGFLPIKNPKTLDFIIATTANWRAVLDEMPVIAPQEPDQHTVIVAGEFLPPQEYLAFVSRVCDLRTQNRIRPGALRAVLWANMVKRSFLAYNYDHVDVVPIIVKLRSQVTKDFPGDWESYFDSLVSGEMKTRIIEKRTRYGDGMPEEIANYDETPYLRLRGGSVKEDVEFIVKRPVQALTSLTSPDRTKWSMIVALALVIGAAYGLVRLLIKIKRRIKR